MNSDFPLQGNPGARWAGRHRAGRAIHGQRFVGDQTGMVLASPARGAFANADDGNGRLGSAVHGLEGRG